MTMTRMTLPTAGTVDTNDAGPLRSTDTAGTAWGACRIRLVADRVPSLRAGSTHKVYRGLRFAAVMRQGQPQPGTTVFTVPVDPLHLATSRSRYALVQLKTPGATTGEATASFSWSISKIGTADPFCRGAGAGAAEAGGHRLDAGRGSPHAVREVRPERTQWRGGGIAAH